LFIISGMGKYAKEKRDIYYRKAKEVGFRARSAFKLLHIDDEFNIFNNVTSVVDLCAAPGSWSQVISGKMYQSVEEGKACVLEGKPRAVAVDLQEMADIPGVVAIVGDITSKQTADKIIENFNGNKVDLIVCDGAPDVTGLHDIDEFMQGQLMLSALAITTNLLKTDGTFVAKIFHGRDISMLYSQFRCYFNNVTISKPRSSRYSSVESFIVCQGYNPPKNLIVSMETMMLDNSIPQFKNDSEAVLAFTICGDLKCVNRNQIEHKRFKELEDAFDFDIEL
jgi:tRNA (cytidine32/guanosine34-2'-O)-methyltransferase